MQVHQSERAVTMDRNVIGRRAFLKLQLAAGAWMTGLAGPWWPAFASDVPDLVAVQGQPGPATRAAVDLLGGMGAFVKPGARVVIKPNMTFPYYPDMPTTTHPAVVKELVVLCRESGAGRIRILDHTLANEEDACLRGIREACGEFRENMAHALNSERFYKAVPIPEGKQLKETRVMKDVLDADVLISVPVAKSHMMAVASLSLKNMMGLIWDRQVLHYGCDLSTGIVDLGTLLRPHLTVVDATLVLTSGGPYGGVSAVVKRENTIIASRDPVAADAFTIDAYEWWDKRYRHAEIKMLRLAHERGLGRMDVENLKIKRVAL